LAEEQFISLSEAAALSGLSQKHLNLLARRGLLRSQKIGRYWVTTESAVAEYLADATKRSRDPLKNKRT